MRFYWGSGKPESSKKPLRKKAYCLALRQTQGAIRTASLNWQPWLVFFLCTLAEQVRRLKRKVERERILLAKLPQLSMQVLELTRAHGPITLGDAAQITGGNRNTLKQHFRALVGNGHLAQCGAGQGVSYEFVSTSIRPLNN